MRIGQGSLKSVADLDTRLAVLDGHQEDYAIVSPLLAYLPRLGNPHAEILEAVPLKRGHNQHDHLVGRFRLETSQQGFNPGLLLGGEEICVIVYIPFGRRNLQGRNGPRKAEQECEEQGSAQDPGKNPLHDPPKN